MTDPVVEAERWIRSHLEGTIVQRTPVAGGCINRNTLLQMDTGQRLFIKAHTGAEEGFLLSEAHALARARATRTLVTPDVLVVDREWLIMEGLTSHEPEEEDWVALGTALAALHRHTAPCFGLDEPSWCGLTPLDNTRDTNGWRFFSERRLKPLVQAGVRLDRLPEWTEPAVEKLGQRLPELIPEQPASLLHGDFWRGNVFFSTRGPAYIDPAQYYGWREADLAMSRLFGLLSPSFYAAYQAAWPLEPGFTERCDLYNLFHLLNHVVLFGHSYTPSVLAILRPFRPS